MNLKITIVVALALVAVVLGTLYYVAGTPRYSLYLVRNAVREKDRETFYRHFDLDRVIENTVSRTVGGVPAGPGVVSQKAIDFAVPVARRVIAERVDARLADPGDAPILAMHVDDVRYDGDSAYVTLADAEGKKTIVSMIRMRDRHWKIVDLDLSKANVEFAFSDMM